MPLVERVAQKANIEMYPFVEVFEKYRDKVNDAAASGGSQAPPADWKLPSGTLVDDDNPGSVVYGISGRPTAAFYFCDKKTGRYTLFSVDMQTMAGFPVSIEGQFHDERDARALAQEYVLGRITFTDIFKAHEKGKGYNAAEVCKFKANQARTSNLIAYRAKMRGRQLPLKVAERFDFLTDLAEREQITTGQIIELLKFSLSLDAAAQRDVQQFDVSTFDVGKYNVSESKRLFVAADNGVDPE